MTKHGNTPLLLTPDDMAATLEVPRMRPFELVQLELVPLPVKIFGHAYWRREDVVEWTASFPVTTPDEAASLLWLRWHDQIMDEMGNPPQPTARSSPRGHP